MRVAVPSLLSLSCLPVPVRAVVERGGIAALSLVPLLPVRIVVASRGICVWRTREKKFFPLIWI